MVARFRSILIGRCRGSGPFTSLRYLHEVDDLKTKFLLGDLSKHYASDRAEKTQWALWLTVQ